MKSGAGQYFTPCTLIHAMVEVMCPTPADTVVDPACGTGGFLLAAGEYLNQHFSDAISLARRNALQHGRSVRGVELIDATARLAAMNMFLHGIGRATDDPAIDVRDALATKPSKSASMVLVLANSPFGKSSITVVGEDGRAEREDVAYNRQDFWVTTTNKQLNFVQHIASMLSVEGRAAVVVPENVLFEAAQARPSGGACSRSTTSTPCSVRPPTSSTPAGSRQMSCFDRKQARPVNPWTDNLWVYDFRTGQQFTLKQRPLRDEHLQPFVEVFHAEDRSARIESERFRAFAYDELVARDKANLDITWLKDPSLTDADDGVPAEIIAQEIVEDLTAALSEFSPVATTLAARAAELARATT